MFAIAPGPLLGFLGDDPAEVGGISSGEFEEALVALLGKDAGGLSASTITRLKECERALN